MTWNRIHLVPQLITKYKNGCGTRNRLHLVSQLAAKYRNDSWTQNRIHLVPESPKLDTFVLSPGFEPFWLDPRGAVFPRLFRMPHKYMMAADSPTGMVTELKLILCWSLKCASWHPAWKSHAKSRATWSQNYSNRGKNKNVYLVLLHFEFMTISLSRNRATTIRFVANWG